MTPRPAPAYGPPVTPTLSLPAIDLPDLALDRPDLAVPDLGSLAGLPLIGLLVLAVAALVVVLAARSGWRRGASRLVLSLLGVVAGVLVAGDVARWVDGRWPQGGWSDTGLLVGTVLVLAVVGGALGSAVGGAVAGVLRRLHLQVLDRTAGAVVRGGLAVAVCALAITLWPGSGTVGPVADQARDAVSGAVDVVASR